MSQIIEVTTSSQVRSLNAVADIEFHSGKKNRGKIKHSNEQIDTERSHLNVEFDIFDREELLWKHWGEKIKKRNANNNSASRRWETMDDFLKSFEGKTVKAGGVQTENKKWSTLTQISTFGGQDCLGALFEPIKGVEIPPDAMFELFDRAGVPKEEIMEVYTEGYEEYIHKHNEVFPMLPIYHSDLHFDETTPHSHDAIVVMGHTKNGNPSYSFNAALGEKYGYGVDSRQNMAKYRADNDTLLFKALAPRLQQLGSDYGLDFKFKATRTGKKGHKDFRHYKQAMDIERREEKLEAGIDKFEEFGLTLQTKRDELKEKYDAIEAREAELESWQVELNEQEAYNNLMVEKNEREAEEMEREKERLKQQEERMRQREADISARETALATRESDISRKEKNVAGFNVMAEAVALAVLAGDEERQKSRLAIQKNGITAYNPKQIEKLLVASLGDVNKGLRRRKVGTQMSVDMATANIEGKMDRGERSGGPEF